MHFYRPDPAAQVITDRTKFSTSIGLEFQGPRTGDYLGEQASSPRVWRNGSSLEPYPGNTGCTVPTIWENGSIGPGGVFDKEACCSLRYYMYYNGTTNKTIASDTGLPAGHTARSIAFWVLPRSLADSQVAVYWGTFLNSRSCVVSTVNSHFAFQFTGLGYWHHTTNLQTGIWQHVVCTLDGTANNAGGKVYFNGVDETTLVSIVLINTLNSALYLGNHPAGAPLVGSLDDVRLYSIALSQAEIDEIYNGGEGTQDAGSQSANLLSWYKFDEGAPPALDSGSRGANATTTLGSYTFGGVPIF